MKKDEKINIENLKVIYLKITWGAVQKWASLRENPADGNTIGLPGSTCRVFLGPDVL